MRAYQFSAHPEREDIRSREHSIGDLGPTKIGELLNGYLSSSDGRLKSCQIRTSALDCNVKLRGGND